MEKLELEPSKCLDPDKPSSCFIRVIPGAEAAWFTKINPQSNWGNQSQVLMVNQTLIHII